MQEVFDILITSLFQGVFEFLPISSSAHLDILNTIFVINNFDQIKFFAELATFTVTFVYFFFIIKTNVIGFIKGQKLSILFFLKILTSTIPFMFGFLLFYKTLHNISLFLIVGSILMIITEKQTKNRNTNSITEITFKQAFIIGIFQIFSIFSGFSRSGSTICGGLICGLKRGVAVQYSFLISLPITFCSLINDFYKLKITNLYSNISTFILCFFIGIISIKILINFLSNHKLYYFAYYRILLAIIIIFAI
jgi:undecaprenyl-diphosphatase